MRGSLVEKDRDYSHQASYYHYRPSYAARAVDALSAYVGAKDGHRVVDIGAGTGNFSLMLLERGFAVTALEPTDAMRAIGIARTQPFERARWLRATAQATTLPDTCADWVTFAGSFHTVSPQRGLEEAWRILVPNGFLTIVGNHIDFADPIQKVAIAIIANHIPGFDMGQRHDRRPLLEQSPLFHKVFFSEANFRFNQPREHYIKAWGSVKNNCWDLASPSGRHLFQRIAAQMERELPAQVAVPYTTRAWTAQKVME